jgi:hypothetical protein
MVPTMKTLTRIYHRDVLWPAWIELPRPGLQLGYSGHALAEATADNIRLEDLPTALPGDFLGIEATTFGGRMIEAVLRFPLDAPGGRPRDIVIAVRHDGLVKTVYANWADDLHTTLRRERYEQEE